MHDELMMGILEGPRGTLIYGVDGVGKTTFATQYEKPVVVAIEKGAHDLPCAKFKPVKDFEALMSRVEWLYSQPHEFRTAAFDALDGVDLLIKTKVCRARGVETVQDVPYGKGPAALLPLWRQFLDGCDALKEHRGMEVVLISHADIEKFKDPTTDPYDRYVPAMFDEAADMVCAWCDEVFFANYRVLTKKVDAGFNRTEGKVVDAKTRVLYTTFSGTHRAKNRLCLPDEITFDRNAFNTYWQARTAFFANAV